MPENDAVSFIEFTQVYEDGARVIKRGMEASPMVIRKHDLGEEEVVAFTSWHGDNKALTAFHFHPSFPVADRRDYMRKHEDGIALLDEVRSRKEVEGSLPLGLPIGRWETFKQQLSELGGLMERFIDLILRTLHPPQSTGKEERPSSDDAESQKTAPYTNAVADVSSLPEKQRRALPESFARAGALPHWERGYGDGPLSEEEVIALEQDKAREQSGHSASPTIH